ncbi:MAG: SRPBCC family protein [Myxococcales bacterium]|nr:SRPBCC family protein [Myxococcales bacterium]
MHPRAMLYLVGLAAPLGLFALYVHTRPAAFRIVRSRVINASPAAVFAKLNSFRAWQSWSPWEGIDPQLERTYEGPEAGPGAVYKWRGNNKVGEGMMKLTESVPGAKVALDLTFIKPFPAENKTVFTLEAEGDATRVTWEMRGENAFMAKAFGVFVNMDALVGKDFVKGLDQLAATL